MKPSILIILLLFSLVDAHSYVFTNVGKPRYEGIRMWDNAQTPPCVSPKDKGNPGSVVVERGRKISFNWPRNNHNGGFIKLAIVPFDQSDDQNAFDKNVFHYGCFQSTCVARDMVKEPFGLDPPEFGEYQNMCNNELTIPDWIEDGQYTIQWKWYGGSGWEKVPDITEIILTGMGTFLSCLDFTVKGGPKKSKPSCPTWNGGDVHTKDGKTCIYFKPDSISVMDEYHCAPQLCRGKNLSGIPPEVEKFRNNDTPYAITPGQNYGGVEKAPKDKKSEDSPIEQVSEVTEPEFTGSNNHETESQSSAKPTATSKKQNNRETAGPKPTAYSPNTDKDSQIPDEQHESPSLKPSSNVKKCVKSHLKKKKKKKNA